MQEQQVRWGILGTARIATKVGAAIRNASNADLSAIASRNYQKAADWKSEHQAMQAYGSYQELLEDPVIDALYIPLPPSLHREWTIKAAEHKKHVLCEKPLALNVSEVDEMIAACREHGVQLMDGVMWYHHPRTKEMFQLISDGELGSLRRVTSAFTFHWTTIPQNEFRLERNMGGGSLYDLGWYCVGATLQVLKRLPRKVLGTARYSHDVDMNFRDGFGLKRTLLLPSTVDSTPK